MDRDRSRRGGVNRAAAILLALIGVMLVVIAIPGWRAYRYRAQKLACEQAMKSARDGLIIEYLSHWEAGTVQQAMETLDEVLPERANICPAGGTVYLVRGEDGIYEPVCGMHDSDRKRRVRLNASRAMDLLHDALRLAREAGEEEPESVEITLNGASLECVRTPEVLDLHRGTRSTNGYKGIVAFYGLAGDGAIPAGGLKQGEIAYFVYADEDHAAVWSDGDGWTGDAYREM